MTLPGRDHKTQLYQVGGMVSLLFQRGGILMVLRFRNAQFQFFFFCFSAAVFWRNAYEVRSLQTLSHQVNGTFFDFWCVFSGISVRLSSTFYECQQNVDALVIWNWKVTDRNAIRNIFQIKSIVCHIKIVYFYCWRSTKRQLIHRRPNSIINHTFPVTAH